MIALSQTRSGKNGGTFVNNRARKIRLKVELWQQQNIKYSFLYVNTHDNPADCATRGLNSSTLLDHYWWTGPPFLQRDQEAWPKTKELEMIWSPTEIAMQLLVKNANKTSSVFRYEISNWTKLKRSTAIVLKFVKILGKDRYRNTSPFTDLQICAGSHCVETLVTDSELSFMFPASICLHEHMVRIKLKHDTQTKLSTITCPPSPFCEMIDCYFCLVMVNNPDCLPKTAITIVMILFYLLASICMTICVCKTYISTVPSSFSQMLSIFTISQ